MNRVQTRRLRWAGLVVAVGLLVATAWWWRVRIDLMAREPTVWRVLGPALLAAALLVLMLLALYQVRRNSIFPAVSNNLLMLAPGAALNGLALLAWFYSPDASRADVLNAIFGASGLLSFTLALVVLVTFRSTFSNEVRQTENAIEVLRTARGKLVFLALTPNIGFAQLAREGRWALCEDYCHAFRETLLELATRGGDVLVGLLDEVDAEQFYKGKEAKLRVYAGRSRVEMADKGYREFTTLVREYINDAQHAADQAGNQSFRVVRWRRGCLSDDPTRPGTRSGNFPPLGILIADNRLVNISYNAPLLSDQPVDLRGKLLRNADDVESFALFVDAYVDHYQAQPEPVAVNEPAGAPAAPATASDTTATLSARSRGGIALVADTVPVSEPAPERGPTRPPAHAPPPGTAAEDTRKDA